MTKIRSGTLPEIETVVANLRAIDRKEIFCQFEPEHQTNLADMAYELGSSVCFIEDEPVAVFSFSPINCATVAVNLFGTDGIDKAIPAITRHIFSIMIPEALAKGIHRFEARSIVSHGQAHRWLEECGARIDGRLNQMGRNGEDFYLFSLTRSRLKHLKLKRWQR